MLSLSARKAFLKSRPARVELVNKTSLTPETCLLSFRPESAFPFVEGQSIGVLSSQLSVHHRLYSIASAAHDGLIDLCVRRVSGGVFSNFLSDMSPGDSAEIFGPLGKELCLEKTEEIPRLILVATGTGIAPFRAILRKLQAENFPGKVDLYFGARTEGDILFKTELDALVKEITNFNVHFILSKEGRRLYVQDAILNDLINISEDLEKATVMICGNKAMGKAVIDVFEKLLGKDAFKNMKKQKRLKIEVY